MSKDKMQPTPTKQEWLEGVDKFISTGSCGIPVKQKVHPAISFQCVLELNFKLSREEYELGFKISGCISATPKRDKGSR